MEFVFHFLLPVHFPKQTLHQYQLISEKCRGNCVKEFENAMLLDVRVGRRDNLVGITTSYDLGGFWPESQQKQNFLSSKTPQTRSRIYQAPSSVFFPGVERLGPEVDR
jgi:hypothetical protein